MSIFSATHPILERSPRQNRQFEPLRSLRNWITYFPIEDIQTAKIIRRLIPASCPFERDIKLLGRKFHIPALCSLNPFYQELLTLRFRAEIYLSADSN